MLGVFIEPALCKNWKTPRDPIGYLSSSELRHTAKAIWLTDCNDGDLARLACIRSVRILSVESDRATDEGLVRVLHGASADEIEYLRVVGPQFTDRLMSQLGQLTKLRSFELKPRTLAGAPTAWHGQLIEAPRIFVQRKRPREVSMKCDAFSRSLACD